MKKILITILTLLIISCNETPKKKVDQKEQPSQKEWVILFDGKSFDGWHQFNEAKMSSAWDIIDGAMVFDPSKQIEKKQNHDLVTDKEYTNFELSLEWNIAEGGNSGIFWGVKEGEQYGKPYTTGPEIQVLDNERHPDALANPKFHQAGALYDMVQPTQDVCKAAGEWNDVLLSIDYNTNKGSVTLNGVEIVTFPVSGEKWDALIANSKFSDWDHFAKFKTGKIGLQDHGDMVSYRNIKIREL
tara:strand:- start:217 stop:945 length:729 start_codon:yes stop_codon:yes gene_type:complete